MKQTAVEWLLEQLKINNYIQLSDHAHWVIDEAKEMEKQQIIEAFNLLKENEVKQEFLLRDEQYYNETFKK